MVDGNRLQELAKFALEGIALLQTNLGSRDTVTMALTVAQKMDDNLMRGCFGSASSFRALEFEPEQDRIRDQKYPKPRHLQSIDKGARAYRNGGRWFERNRLASASS
jgi:hypothetical protein